MKIVYSLTAFFVLVQQSFAYPCREMPQYDGIDSMAEVTSVARNEKSSNPMDLDIKSTVYERWAYERHEIEYRWEPCFAPGFDSSFNNNPPPPPPRMPPPTPRYPHPPVPRRDDPRYPPQRMCRRAYDVCRVYIERRNEHDVTQKVRLIFPSKVNLKNGQSESFTITYDPLNKGTIFGIGQALKIDAWSWHHLYKAVRMNATELDPNKTLDIQMDAVW